MEQLNFFLKTCTKCKIQRPRAEFHRNKGRRDGRTSICATCSKSVHKKHYTQNRERILETNKRWAREHPEQRKQRYTKYHRQVKQKIVDAYGGECECCGETALEFLTIDHINGRKPGEPQGTDLYGKLVKLGFPKDNLRLLCIGCNFAYGKYGHCPHNKKD